MRTSVFTFVLSETPHFFVWIFICTWSHFFFQPEKLSFSIFGGASLSVMKSQLWFVLKGFYFDLGSGGTLLDENPKLTFPQNSEDESTVFWLGLEMPFLLFSDSLYLLLLSILTIVMKCSPLWVFNQVLSSIFNIWVHFPWYLEQSELLPQGLSFFSLPFKNDLLMYLLCVCTYMNFMYTICM